MLVTRSLLIRAFIVFTLALAMAPPVCAQGGNNPRLEMDVTAAEKNAKPGEQIRFEIKAEVNRTATATNVVITNPVPSDSSFVSATGGGVYDEPANTVTWTLPLLVEGEESTFELILRVDNPTAAVNITNSASMTSDENFADTSRAQDSDFVNIKTAPFVVITKSASVSFVEPGDEVTFTIDYLNEGNATANDAVLSDALPPFTTFVDATLGGTYDGNTNTVTWPADDIDDGVGGSLLLILAIDADAPAGTVITNTAVMTGSNFEDASGAASVTVQSAPQLGLTKTADVSFASPGEQITYFLEFTNTGNADATDLVLEDLIPAFTTFVSSTGGGVFDGTKVTWSQPVLEPRETGSVSMTVLVDSGAVLSTRTTNGDVISNVATLSASNAATVPVENRIPVVAIPLLVLDKAADADFIKAGTNVTYTLSYVNSGTATAENVVLEDFIPEFTTFVTATGGGQQIDGKVVWTDPGLTPGAKGQVQLVLLIDESAAEGQQVSNTASMTSDNSSPVASSKVVTVRNAPILQISKTANAEFVQPGDLVAYTIEFTNDGNVDASTVTVQDLLPAGTTFMTASGDGVLGGNRVAWAFPFLGVGQVGSVSLVVSVDAGTIDTDIQNNVTIDSANALAASASNVVTSRSRPILTLEKAANLAFVEAGGQVTFTLSYANEGNLAASNVVLKDFLPDRTSFVSAGGGGVYDPVDNSVTWTDPGLAAGGSGQLQLTLKVDDVIGDDLVIVNSATITSDSTTPVTAIGSVIVSSSASLFLNKIADVDIATPGDVITFALSFGNGGNATAENVVLEDLIPDGTTFVSASGGGALSAGQVRWDLGNLAVGEQGSVSLTVRVDADQVNGDYINNVATLDSSNAFAVSATDSVIVSVLPVLSLAKTSSADFVVPGGSITFTLSYENTGNAAATNIVLADAIPQNTTFVSATGGGVLSGNEVIWTDPNFGPGAFGQVQLTLAVDPATPDDWIVLNSATLNSDETPPLTSNDNVTVKRAPLLHLTKTANSEQVSPGEEVTFTLEFSNSGNGTARNLVLEDPIPAHTTFVSATAGGTLTDGIVRWTGAELPPGNSGAVALTVRVDTGLQPGLVITNSATIDAENAFAVLSTENIVVQSQPVLTLDKTANNAFVEAGEIASFLIQTTNTGNARANQVVIDDAIPAGTTYVSSSPGSVYDPDSNSVRWAIDSIAVGATASVGIDLRIDDGLAEGAVINNSATVDSDETQPVTASDGVQVKRSPLLTLSKDSNLAFVGPGGLITYTLVAGNIGNADAVNAVLEDPIPANTSFVSATGGGVFADGKVTWTFPALPIGTPASVSMTVQVDAAAIIDVLQPLQDGTLIHNTATLDSPDAYAVSAEDTVMVKFSPALSISKIADTAVAIPGTQITYQLIIENTGNVTATNLVTEDTLPDNVTFVSASDGGAESDGIVSWTLASLGVGESAELLLIVLVNTPLADGTTIFNSASLRSDETSPVSANNTLNVQSSPLLSLVKSADKTLASPGDQVTYTLQIENTGNANASGVLVDLIPDHTTFVAASNGGLENSGRVTWTLPNILVGQPQTVTLTVLVDTPLDPNTLILNRAGLISDQVPPVTTNHSLYVSSSPAFTLAKTVDKALVTPGTQLLYTLTYGNTGNANAVNTVLQDQLPANTSFVSASGGGTESGGMVTWNNGTLDAGASGSVSLTVLVDTPLDNGTVIDNFAGIESDLGLPVLATATSTVQSAPLLELDNIADVSLVPAGGQVVYTLEYANNGTANASGVTLQDWLPAHTTFVAASDGGSEAGGIVSWPLSSLAAGDSGSVTLTVAVASPLPDATKLFNIASINSTEGQPDIGAALVVVQSAPALTLSKTASATVVQPGDLLTYTLAFANSGNANATGVVLQDTVPANTTFVSASGGGVESGGVVTWTAPELPVGVPASVTLTVEVDTPLPDGTLITNTASLVSDQSAAVNAEVTTTVDSAPVLVLTKSANATVVNPGDQITYTLSLANSGNANATNVVLEDTLPANTRFVSASGGGTETGGVVTWTAPQLPVGVPASVTLTVEVDTPLANGTLIHNSATLESDETASVGAEHTLTVQSAPVLTLSKSASASVVNPGDQITYTLSLANCGNANASNVVLQDTIPEHTTFVSASGGGTEAGGVVTWTTPQLLVGVPAAVTLTVQADTPLADGTVITNQASLTSDQTVPVTDQVTTTVDSAPVLALAKTADKTVVNPGDQITYTLSLQNTGNANASNIVLRDTIPDHTTFVSASAGGTESNGVVTWTTPELPVGPGGSVTLTVLVDTPLDNGTSIYNSATLESDETVPVSAANTLAVQSAPVLTLTKTADKTVVNPGDQITYTLALSNTGNANASNLVLQDTLPANTTFVSASAGGTELDGVVTWTTPGLPVGVPASVTLTVLVDTPLDNGTSIYNSATLESDETAPVSANHTLAVQSAPVLVLAKTADATVVNPGDEITYTLALSNTGNANASNLVLQDTLPANTTFVSASAGGTESNGVVTWTTPELPVGVPASVTLTVLVDTPLDNGTSIYNSATLESDETAPVSAANTLAVQSSPVLVLAKTADKAIVNPGDQITYILSLQNTGNANASNIVLQDTIPDHTRFVSASAGGTESNGVVTWTTPELPAGLAGSVTLTVLVDTPLDNGTAIYNSATLDSAETAPVSSDHTLAVQSSPVLALSKTADKTVVSPGETITYTLVFSNTGNANASGVLLTDHLPPDTTFLFATGGATENEGTVTWPSLELTAGSSGSVQMMVGVNSPLADATRLHNVAALDSAGQSSPVVSSASVVVQSAPIPGVTKSADVAAVVPGGLMTYTIDYLNSGNDGLFDAQLTDGLPAGTTFVSASGGGVFDGDLITWNIGQLDAGIGGAVTLAVRALDTLQDGQIVTNTVSLLGSNAPPVSAQSVTPVNGSAILEISKSAMPSSVLPGGQITYTIGYANSGNAVATGLVIEDLIPVQTQFVSASDGGTFANGVVTWSLPDLAPGEGGSLTLNVIVDEDTPGNSIVTNTATLSGEAALPASASAEATVQDPLSDIPVLTIGLTPDRSEIAPGESVLYAVDYGNVAPAEALDVEIVALLPANVSFEGASDGGVLESNGSLNWIRWQRPVLPGNTAGGLSYRVRHQPNAQFASNNPSGTNAERIEALASITASNALPVTSDPDSARVLVRASPLPPGEPMAIPVANPRGLALMALLILVLGFAAQRRKWLGFT